VPKFLIFTAVKGDNSKYEVMTALDQIHTIEECGDHAVIKVGKDYYHTEKSYPETVETFRKAHSL
jgi:hypothetical protein